MGGRFCSLDQRYKKFSGNDVFPPPKLIEDRKQKGLRQKLKSFFPEIRWRPKKKVFAAISAGNLQDLLVLAGYFSCGHPALSFRWEDA